MSDYLIVYPSILIRVICTGGFDVGSDGEEAAGDVARIGWKEKCGEQC